MAGLFVVALAAVALIACKPPVKKTGKPGRTPEAVLEGKAVYEKNCLECHGPEGKGDGPTQKTDMWRPRDFTSGKFKYISTSNGVPTEQDLFDVAWNGIPDTEMKGWEGRLTDHEVWSAIYYVQRLAALEGKKPEPTVIPPRPGGDLKRQGTRVFIAWCSKCHGEKGEADGIAGDTLVDDRGDKIMPRNLVRDLLRGGDAPEEIFQRVKYGLRGTPMVPPDGYNNLTDEEVWAVVEHVRSLRKPASD